MPHGRDGRLFRAPDEVPEIADIQRRCEKKGADFEFLWSLAQLALSAPPKLSRSDRACFERLQADLPCLIGWLRSYTEGRAVAFALERIRFALNSDRAIRFDARRKRRRAGRPPGVSLVNLVMATMAQEFRRHFRKPCYREILALITEMRRDEFAEADYGVDAIRQRIKRVPKSQVSRFRRRLVDLRPPAYPVRNPR